jgi:type II secretory pathway pseudopilin PulG
MTRKGFTLSETFVVITCTGLLSGILLPSLSSARGQAKRAACASQMHQISLALTSYAAANHFCMPPFRFSDIRGTLPLSGHWGGPSQPDPLNPCNPRPINLWCLTGQSMLASAHLLCPAAPGELRGSGVSLFANTQQFSTYGLRFPLSGGLFNEAPSLPVSYKPGLLGVYLRYAGGDRARVGPREYQTVPLVRLDRRYELDPAVCFSRSVFDPAADAVVSDEFFWQDRSESAPRPLATGLKTYAVSMGWSHGRYFNVLFGSGAARTVADDGTVAANSVPPGGSPVDDGHYFGKYSEKVWQYFDAAK